MRKPNLIRRGRAGNDGAALVVAAIGGLVLCLIALASAVDAIAPIVQQQLTAVAVIVS